MSQLYQVLLLLADPPAIVIPPFKIKGDEYTVQISTALGSENVNSFELIISDKTPDEIKTDLKASSCKSKTIIIRKNFPFEFRTEYEKIFDRPKYRTFPASEKEWPRLIKAELVKWLAINNTVTEKYLFVCKHTRLELWKRSAGELWLLLVPFFLILLYYTAKEICGSYGYHISLLTCFVDYQPDSDRDWKSDLRLVTLLYSLCNLAFYYAFILKIFESINTEMLQPNKWRSRFHKFCQLVSPFLLFVTSVIIFKELFVFKKGQLIAQEYDFINIGLVFDKRLPFLKEDYLIIYFLIIDVLLWLMMFNVIKAMKIFNPSVPNITSGRKEYLTSAQRNAFRSCLVSGGILAISAIAYPLMPDPQSKVVTQLFFLQFFYLLVNLLIICAEFKHE